VVVPDGPKPTKQRPGRRGRFGSDAASLADLLQDLNKPPIEKIGALDVDSFLPKTERKALAAALNTLLASPTFASWREGATLDVGDWLKPMKGKTPAVIVRVAHLDDDERALVLGVLLEEVLSWVRSLPGSSRLKALLVFDEGNRTLHGWLSLARIEAANSHWVPVGGLHPIKCFWCNLDTDSEHFPSAQQLRQKLPYGSGRLPCHKGMRVK
jgi:hypothetical protein